MQSRVSDMYSPGEQRGQREREGSTFELGEEDVDDLVLLDGQREEVDLLNRLDLAVLYETTKLGDGSPMHRDRGA